MNTPARHILQKIIVAVTLGVAALATWAVTDTTTPAVGIAQSTGLEG